LKGWLCPGFKVKGRLTAPSWKSAPLTLSCETVKLVEPELVKISGLEVVCPTATLPKLIVDALGVIWPATTACPDNAKVAEFCGAELAIATVVDGEPAPCGVN